VGLWSRYRQWRLRHVGRIDLNDDGFAVITGGATVERIAFAGIATVHAFKRDLYTADMICLLIAARDGAAVEVNEQMQGYPELVDRIDALPATLPAWQLHVMFPAFDPCLTQIYPAEPA
jgi:hypothetical protein